MSKKEFYGAVSITARLGFRIEAESEEEAKEKLFNACCPISLEDEEGKEIEITDQEWEMIDRANRGNVQQSYVEDFYIEQEED
ncbi:hypothetical protein [Clostridium paraputrificum]|uniref:hypothetical protein n=1 Tax=Clostridium paraputrificum TaxID=29363 RepID=UPI001B3C7D1A|nr:hypothetical protein [Clostridium paraputrificum]